MPPDRVRAIARSASRVATCGDASVLSTRLNRMQRRHSREGPMRFALAVTLPRLSAGQCLREDLFGGFLSEHLRAAWVSDELLNRLWNTKFCERVEGLSVGHEEEL